MLVYFGDQIIPPPYRCPHQCVPTDLKDSRTATQWRTCSGALTYSAFYKRVITQPLSWKLAQILDMPGHVLYQDNREQLSPMHWRGSKSQPQLINENKKLIKITIYSWLS